MVTRMSIVAAGLIAMALPSHAHAQADSPRVTLSVFGGATIGDSRGGTIGGDATLKLIRAIDVVLGVSRLSDITPDDLVAGATTVAAAVGATATVHQDANVFEAGVRLRVPTGSFAEPYAIAGGGSARITTETAFRRNGVADPNALGMQLGRDLDHRISKRSLLLGVGVNLLVARHAAIDAGVRYHRLFAKTSHIPGDLDRTVVRLQIGAGIRF
jgi:opacity protein-like surface antigen